MILKNKLQNIYNQLFSLLTLLKIINIKNLSFLPNQINKIIIGENKIFLYLNKTIKKVTENDLSGVTSIDINAFNNCTNLTDITIPNSVTRINANAFTNCTSLTNITIPNSVTSIGIGAFTNCTSLTDITIPNSVTSIGNDAFWFCRNLTDIYMYPIIPPTLGSTIFLLDDITIHVPIGSGDAYKNATNWSAYADQIVEDIEI